ERRPLLAKQRPSRAGPEGRWAKGRWRDARLILGIHDPAGTNASIGQAGAVRYARALAKRWVSFLYLPVHPALPGSQPRYGQFPPGNDALIIGLGNRAGQNPSLPQFTAGLPRTLCRMFGRGQDEHATLRREIQQAQHVRDMLSVHGLFPTNATTSTGERPESIVVILVPDARLLPQIGQTSRRRSALQRPTGPVTNRLPVPGTSRLPPVRSG